MDSPAWELYSTDGPINQMYMQTVEGGNGAQQIHQLLDLVAYPDRQPASATVVFDHAGVVIHVLHVYNIVLNVKEVALREASLAKDSARV